MESDAKFLEVLRQHWGYTSFRSIQLDIIRSIASGHDTLGLMPTGGGKSLTFQVPALVGEGMCLVVTPLIALMKDQVVHLRQHGIMAAAVYSGPTPEEVQRTLDNAVFGAYKLLYVSPERLSSELFRSKVQRMGVSFVTVDEAHCISQWGYDFRPAYLEIAQLRTLLPDAPVLALTATATPAVCDDICRQLQFREDAQRFRMSFERT
ncbi:MAG: DEAD/DEAH box helicase, partial [Alloprevotella sp.]|nr:DEAD/DEAH box helicase [Alloprevotella sp.]